MAEWIYCEYGCGTLITFRREGSRSVAYDRNGQHRCLQEARKSKKGKRLSGPFLKWLPGLSFKHMVAAIIIIVIAIWIDQIRRGL
jgi:hypothetical protein